MQTQKDSGQTEYGFKPFTVSAIYCDGSGKVISHCYASDAQAARDQVLMQTGGGAIIASVFAGHLIEAETDVLLVQNDSATETEAASNGIEEA
jgi:hypothetical protein